MPNRESTSPRVATIAGRMLRPNQTMKRIAHKLTEGPFNPDGLVILLRREAEALLTWMENVEILAASALTQRPNKSVRAVKQAKRR